MFLRSGRIHTKCIPANGWSGN